MLLELLVIGNKLHAGNNVFTCAHGKGGFKSDKREGDGATPLGRFPLRCVLYRPDHIEKPETHLPLIPIALEDGWCDDPESELYNLMIKLPPAQGEREKNAERLWRPDHLYDIVIPIGYNDAPIIPGKGSAIFMHIAKPGYLPTEGCIALALPDMLTLLPLLGAETTIEIREK